MAKSTMGIDDQEFEVFDSMYYRLMFLCDHLLYGLIRANTPRKKREMKQAIIEVVIRAAARFASEADWLRNEKESVQTAIGLMDKIEEKQRE